MSVKNTPRKPAMRAAKQFSAKTENRLLAVLPEDERSHLLSEATLVSLKKRRIFYYAGDTIKFCYFPVSGMISVLSTTESGKSLILGVVGSESGEILLELFIGWQRIIHTKEESLGYQVTSLCRRIMTETAKLILPPSGHQLDYQTKLRQSNCAY
jgi:hypothetical protein